jgi:TatD DNase family protein
VVPELFDTHCHVHDPRMTGGLTGAVAAARAAGVATLVTVGCDRPSSLAAIEAATTHGVDGVDVWATVGLHPHDAVQGVDTLADLFDAPGSDRVVAVGECGLDYYYDHSPRPVQRGAFAEQIGIAHARGLPLVIHTRDAWDDTFAVLTSEGVPTRTIFHCFTGGPTEAERALALAPDVYLSIPGIVTFKHSDDLRAAALATPLERLVIETDAPYLAPVPFRGKPNQPAYVAHTAQYLADLRGTSLAQFAAATTGNARRAFRLDSL